MALVKFSKKEFEKHVKLSKEIEEKIAMFGTPFEGVENDEIAIEIFPNRPDLLSLHGYIRSFLSFIGKKPGMKKYLPLKPQKDFEVFVDKSVQDVRPFTACAIVKNLKFDDNMIKEIIDIQEKLHATIGRNRKKVAIGIYPLEKIKLPIRFEARKPQDIRFIPLESDKEMDGMQILEQHPTGREYASLLGGMKKFPVFVDSNNEILSMPPIINSHKTGKIDETTKDIFIECSGFDLQVLKKTLNILVTMFADMNGEVYQMKVMYGNKPEITPDLEPEKIKIDINKVNKLLGLNLKEEEIKKLLERMNYEYSKGEVSVPAWRTDILHEVDIIEDIAIAYGYESFIPKLPEISTVGNEDRKEVLKRKISEILIGLGFLETSSYHLLTKEDIEKVGLKKVIEVEKSKTDYKFLRPNLLCSMMKTLGGNIDSEYPQKIFEIGNVFEKNDKFETGIAERTKLIVAMTPANFTEINQVLNYLARALEVNFYLEKEKQEPFIEGRTGKILFRNKQKKEMNIGMIGEIHPSLLREWHLKMSLALFEIDLEKIFEELY